MSIVQWRDEKNEEKASKAAASSRPGDGGGGTGTVIYKSPTSGGGGTGTVGGSGGDEGSGGDQGGGGYDWAGYYADQQRAQQAAAEAARQAEAARLAEMERIRKANSNIFGGPSGAFDNVSAGVSAYKTAAHVRAAQMRSKTPYAQNDINNYFKYMNSINVSGFGSPPGPQPLSYQSGMSGRENVSVTQQPQNTYIGINPAPSYMGGMGYVPPDQKNTFARQYATRRELYDPLGQGRYNYQYGNPIWQGLNDKYYGYGSPTTGLAAVDMAPTQEQDTGADMRKYYGGRGGYGGGLSYPTYSYGDDAVRNWMMGLLNWRI